VHANTEHPVRHYSLELMVLRLVQAQLPKVSGSTGDPSEHCAWNPVGFVSLAIDLKLKGNCHHISSGRGQVSD